MALVAVLGWSKDGTNGSTGFDMAEVLAIGYEVLCRAQPGQSA